MPCGSTPEVLQCAGADSLAQATDLTLLEQDFESALSAIPSGYGEGNAQGAAVRRHRAEAWRRKADGPVRASARRRGRRQLQPLPAEVGRGLFVSLRNAGREGRRACSWVPDPKFFLVIILIGDPRWRTWFASVAFFSFRSEKCSFVAGYISRQEGAPVAVRDQRCRNAKIACLTLGVAGWNRGRKRIAAVSGKRLSTVWTYRIQAPTNSIRLHDIVSSSTMPIVIARGYSP